MNTEPTGDVKPGGTLMRCPSVLVTSSAALGWKDIAVERHVVEPGEKLASTLGYHRIEFACGREVAYGERRNGLGHMTPCQASPGTIYLFAQESLPARYAATKTELIVCGLNTSFITQVAEAEELDGHATADARKEQGFHDKAAATLIRLLEAEVASGGLSGPRYVEHLAYALTVRLLVAKTPREDSFGFGSGSGRGLPVARLRRVLERMDADLATDLDLKTLAVESGYSRNHFLRMFLAATGFTPHQYLLRMRVKRAQALMKDPSKRLIDVALACGFSSQAHLSRVFREVVGAAPGEYRRDVL